MSARVEEVLGQINEPRFEGLRRDYVDMPWFDARKPRQRVRSQSGTELELCLAGGTFISDGAVLWADKDSAVVARREPAQACRITFLPTADSELAIREATVLGHALGNQHIPIEFDGADLLAPILTSESVLGDTIAKLGLTTVEAHFGEERLFAQAPATKTATPTP